VLARVVSSVLLLVEAGEVPSLVIHPSGRRFEPCVGRITARRISSLAASPEPPWGRTNAPTRSGAATPHAVHKPMLLLLRAERRAAVAAGAEPTPTADVGR
jgi:hypothetical protein